MNSNQQISDYIFFYPDVMDKKTCEWIINRYDTTAKWQQSTFSTAYKNTGTSRVAMDEYWIKSDAPYHKELKKSFSSELLIMLSIPPPVSKIFLPSSMTFILLLKVFSFIKREICSLR